MNPLSVWIVIGAAFFPALFLSRGKLALAIAFLGFALIGLGAGSVWLIEKGPQKVFSRAKVFTPAFVAFSSPWATTAGIGFLAGAVVRGSLALAKRRPAAQKENEPVQEQNTVA